MMQLVILFILRPIALDKQRWREKRREENSSRNKYAIQTRENTNACIHSVDKKTTTAAVVAAAATKQTLSCVCHFGSWLQFVVFQLVFRPLFATKATHIAAAVTISRNAFLFIIFYNIKKCRFQLNVTANWERTYCERIGCKKTQKKLLHWWEEKCCAGDGERENEKETKSQREKTTHRHHFIVWWPTYSRFFYLFVLKILYMNADILHAIVSLLSLSFSLALAGYRSFVAFGFVCQCSATVFALESVHDFALEQIVYANLHK